MNNTMHILKTNDRSKLMVHGIWASYVIFFECYLNFGQVINLQVKTVVRGVTKWLQVKDTM